MIDLEDITYVRLGTGNLAEAERYATEILGLQVGRREGNEVYFRSDNREHTLCYFEGDPTDHTVAFEVATQSALDKACAALEEAGHAITLGTVEEMERRRVKGLASLFDPNGNKVELVVRPEVSGWRYFPSRDAGITGFSHVGLCSSNPARDEVFWTNIFNARVSDYIGNSPLLRIDEVHHKIALFPTQRKGVQHINHQVASIDDIMRSWYFLQDRQVRIQFGPGRHPTSGAMFLYFEGPDGMVYEYSTGVSHITDEENHRPRQFPAVPEGFCMWGAKPDIAEFK
ncbi:VOC family protein [uncultured Brevundimonas sp.]|uniref:VOC family protein n=1 Tax=uncultured Brevundimonas sp. TaxID=213418 RepID=UPI002617AA01|nr:VOC family protein [uncultured Brevundimonas sp.]